MQRFEILEYRVKLCVAQFLLREVWHDPQAVAYLEAFQEVRKRLVVQSGPESRLAAWVTLIAFVHERHLAGRRPLAQCQGRSERRPAPRRRTCATENGNTDDQRRQTKSSCRCVCHHRPPVRVTRQSTPVPSCGAAPRSLMVMMPK